MQKRPLAHLRNIAKFLMQGLQGANDNLGQL
jgi:hypothetical protein